MGIRILLADDHTVFAEGLRALLQQHPDFEVIGVASDGREAIRLAVREKPDVAVIDISMSGMNGMEATRRLRKQQPGVRVIGLSMHRESSYVLAMLEAGASGYLLKECGSEELARAIRAAAKGQTFLSPAVTSQVLEALRDGGRASAPIQSLTSRERGILQLIAEGNTSQQIAEYLSISVKTVSSHREHLMRKLDVHSIADLTRLAVREGLVAP